MTEVTNKKLSKILPLSQQFVWYENPWSGAYKFHATTSHEVNKLNVTLKRTEVNFR